MAGLDLTKAAGAMSVVVYCDSQVVTSQMNGDYECKVERIKKYLEQVRKQIVSFRPSLFKSPRKRTSRLTVLRKPHQQNT